MKIPVPTRYPRFMDIDTVSPPVSPSVVARILMTQNPSVIAGTLASACLVCVSIVYSQMVLAKDETKSPRLTKIHIRGLKSCEFEVFTGMYNTTSIRLHCIVSRLQGRSGSNDTTGPYMT